MHHTIVWKLRAPVAVMALVVGGALGAAGAEMQTILNNPLASPYTLGISAAAGFGAALAIAFGAGALPFATAVAVPASAFLWTLLCSFAILLVGRMKNGAIESIILCGVAMLFLFNSGVAFLQYAASEDTLQAIVFWIFGSLQGATWPKIAVITAVLAVSLPLLLFQAWNLTALRLGEDHARSLGVHVSRLRLSTLTLVSILTATAVCFTGAIGFIGLVAPHLSRMSVGEDQRYFLPMSILLGAVLLSAASIASKSLVTGAILPLGIVTAIIGVPFFFTMVLVQKRNYW
ncbi:Hemin transport system permease protein HmuU [Gimesia fumaroli]|uniref:Hemin transport system permease protein HmuU n=2 Tax=Gimesia fumaroli TaxID=2527976 RepID=A0A518I9S0_9PLAN|nr:Hemin transport system permease protein HmuU [Gimesia fumaroli]